MSKSVLADAKRSVWYVVSDKYGNLAHLYAAELQYPNYRGDILMFSDFGSIFQTYSDARAAIRRTLTCSKRHGYSWEAREFKIKKVRREVSG